LEVEKVVEATPGARDVVNPARRNRMDYDLGLDLDKAGLLGIASEDLDRSVRLAVAGYPASKFRDQDGDEFDLTLRLPMNQRPTIELLDDIHFTSRTTGASVPLAQL